jgi:hypothetical protein
MIRKTVPPRSDWAMLRNRIDPTITRLLTRLTDIVCVLAKPERWPHERNSGPRQNGKECGLRQQLLGQTRDMLPPDREDGLADPARGLRG